MDRAFVVGAELVALDDAGAAMDDQGDGTGMRLFFHRERISDRGLEPCFRRPRTTVGRGYAPDNRTAQRRQHALRPWPEEIGRAHVGPPVTNAHLVCRLLLEKKKSQQTT